MPQPLIPLATLPVTQLIRTEPVRLYKYHLRDDGGLDVASTATIPTGHKRAIRCVSWSPSGQNLATASFDSSVAVWEHLPTSDLASAGSVNGDWECVSTIEGHESECKGVAYSPTGTLLATCGRDKSVWIWEVQPDTEFECISVLMEHLQDVKAVAWHPVEEILASASYDNTVKLYVDDPSDDWYPFTTLTGHSSTVWSLSFSSCGNYLATCSDDESTMIWRRDPVSTKPDRSWEPLGRLGGHHGPIFSVSWAPGSAINGMIGSLATAGADGRINIWSLKLQDETLSYEIIATVEAAHESDVNCVSWCPKSSINGILASAGDDGHVKLWQLLQAGITSVMA
ncbi:Cytosolic iron-sulfur protein assembly protein [Tulasnella sp. 403]|nr:Cytosolic iron-sulfur protein assembly protein [Tulasnella sp. 403]